MTRTPFASSTPTSFSSRPGNSAVTLTSLSVSLTSMSGHPNVRSNKRPEPNGATSKPRKTSSNTQFISRCSLQGVDHFIKLDDVTGTEDLPQRRYRFDGTDVRCP